MLRSVEARIFLLSFTLCISYLSNHTLKMLEDLVEITSIGHVLDPFPTEVIKSRKVENFHLVKKPINHHISKIEFSLIHQQMSINKVLTGVGG